MEQHLDVVRRLLGAVRSGDPQVAISLFLSHLRAVATETEEAMAVALASMEGTGTIGDGEFARLRLAGTAYGTMLKFCRFFEKDPAEHVRKACAAGEVILTVINVRPEYAKIIVAMQERISRMS